MAFENNQRLPYKPNQFVLAISEKRSIAKHRSKAIARRKQRVQNAFDRILLTCYAMPAGWARGLVIIKMRPHAPIPMEVMTGIAIGTIWTPGDGCRICQLNNYRHCTWASSDQCRGMGYSKE
jgi:hypothetical protein